MKSFFFFVLAIIFTNSLWSQKLYEKVGEFYYSTDKNYLYKGKFISNLEAVDSFFFSRGVEKYLEYDFGYPFVFLDGNAFFFSLSLHLNFTNRDSTFNYVVLAKSKLLNISILSGAGSYEADLKSLFVPHEFLHVKPILYGLGLDSTGSPIALSVIDSIYADYDFPCDIDSDPLELGSTDFSIEY